MKKSELLLSLRSLFPFADLDFGKVISTIYDLIDRYVKGRYKQYRTEKRMQKLTEYRNYIVYCSTYYQKELELLDAGMSESFSSTQFAEFFYSAKRRWRKQYQKELLYQSICFDDYSLDKRTMQLFNVAQLWKDCDSLSKEIICMKEESSSVPQGLLVWCSAFTDQMRSTLPLAVNMVFNDIAKREALEEIEDISQSAEQSVNFEVKQFYMSVAQFAFYVRKEGNLTQQKLSELCGIKRSTIAKMETMKQIPSYETLIQFLSYFDARLMVCFSSAHDADGRDDILKERIPCDI